MPVAVARKIEHRLYENGIEADITLQPIILTPEQCIEFQLPRTPIKETERRGPNFWGIGRGPQESENRSVGSRPKGAVVGGRDIVREPWIVPSVTVPFILIFPQPDRLKAKIPL